VSHRTVTMTEVKEWLRKHYTQEDSNSLLVKCNYCEKNLWSNVTPDLTFHLCNTHNIMEHDEHLERDNIEQNYIIKRHNIFVICSHCKILNNIAVHGVDKLIEHLKCLHLDKVHLNETETSSSVSTHPKNI